MRFLLLIFLTVNAVLAGTVKGRVTFDGKPPKEEVVKPRTDTVVCGEKIIMRKLELGPEGGVRNAVVWIEGGKGELPQERDVHLRIKDCRFEPHVSIGFVGGYYVIKNDDPILHTVQLKLSLAYKEWRKTRPLETGATVYNLALPEQGMVVKRPIKRYHRYQEKTGFIYVRSNAHPWMRAYIFVFDHPFATLTDEGGNFEIKGLPPGKYTLKVWQETFGIKSKTVEVKGDEVVEVNISLGD